MKRSILLSLLVIGAAGAFMFGTGTFAPFTATDSDEGTITAGTVSITVLGSGTLDFTDGAGGCDSAVLPGDTCGPDTVTVTNTGTVDVTLSSPNVTPSGDLSTCDGGGNLSGATTSLSYTPDTTVIAPNGTATFDITATLDGSAGNDCMGDSGTVNVAVTATSS